MPLEVVITGHEVALGLSHSLVNAWMPLLSRVRAIHVLRSRSRGGTRSGGAGDSLLRHIRCEYDPDVDGDPEAFLGRAVEQAIDLALVDAAGKRQRYGFAVSGDAAPGYRRGQWLVPAIEDWIDGTSETPATPQEETTAILKTVREFTGGLAAEYLGIMAANREAVEALTRISLTQASERNDASRASWEGQVMMAREANQLQIELAQVHRDVKRADRNGELVKALIGMFGGADIAAIISGLTGGGAASGGAASSRASGAASAASTPGSSGAASGSSSDAGSASSASGEPTPYGGATHHEIDRILEHHDDLRSMFHAWAAEADPDAAAALLATLRERWTSLPAAQASGITASLLRVLGTSRALVFAQWIRRTIAT